MRRSICTRALLIISISSLEFVCMIIVEKQGFLFCEVFKEGNQGIKAFSFAGNGGK